MATIIDEAVATWGVTGRRVLVLIPDRTRTAPMPLMYRNLSASLSRHGAAKVTWLVALGTHRPLSREELENHLGTLLDHDRRDRFGAEVVNHAFRAEGLLECGSIDPATVRGLSAGLLDERVAVRCNALVGEHDVAIVCGPVFPHEVVGFSGGNKYLYPGISGPEMINSSHWLGALITSSAIIGAPGTTPVRALIDAAAAITPIERRCLAFVVPPVAPDATGATLAAADLCALFAGDCDDAWSDAAAISAEVHVRRLDRPVARALACVPHRYEDLWTGAKGVYKVEPVVADGGELVLYAPHITACATEHGGAIEEIGYHCRDYFLAQPERFAHVARGVIAHSTHVRGPGTYDAARGIERGRIAVTLATGIGPQQCAAMNVGYLDPAGIDRGAFAATGALVIEHAGETLYRLAAS